MKPPQDTKSDTVLPSHEDEGKSFAGMSFADDKDYKGHPLSIKKLGDLDIFAKARKKNNQ